MRILLAILILVAHLGCSSSQIPRVVGLQDPCATSGVAFAGHYCLGRQSQPLLAGMCNSGDGSDCPKPYNACVNNLCQIAPAAVESDKILFATDPIQPGIALGGAYVYNIMAKGRASLNDWCMSQAQQSTSASMRLIGSWTAQIVSQGNRTFPASSTAVAVYNNLSNAILSQVVPYSSPSGGGGSYAPLSFLDKNGNSSFPLNDTDTDPSAQNIDVFGGIWVGYSQSVDVPAIIGINNNCTYRVAGSFTNVEQGFGGGACSLMDGNGHQVNLWSLSGLDPNGGSAAYMTGFGVINCLSGTLNQYVFTVFDPQDGGFYNPISGQVCTYVNVKPIAPDFASNFCSFNAHSPTFHNGCEQAKGILCLSDQGFPN